MRYRREPTVVANPPLQLLDEHAGDVLRLRRIAGSTPRFQLVIAQFNAPLYASAIMDNLSHPWSFHTYTLTMEDAADATALALINHRVDARIYHVFDEHDWNETRLINLNYQRETIAARLKTLLILWMSGLAVRRCAKFAPDLWAWREAVFNFNRAGEPSSPQRGSQDEPNTQPHATTAHAMRGAIGDATELPNDAYDHGKTHYEQGTIQYQLGNYDSALSSYGRAAELYKTLGRERDAAIAQGNVADILYHRGQLDEALRIRKEVQLPTFERLGDVRAAATTHGNIADILHRRGQLDEALRIHKELELPVFEQLGDLRELAITHRNIANILYDRGQLDEALRSHKELALPIFEQLGDRRETAITYGTIADLLYRDGQFDEALRIHKELELPLFEQLGDLQAAAITHGHIADILYRRGELNEALHIYKHIQLPAFEQLGDVRGTAMVQGKMADILRACKQLDDETGLTNVKQLMQQLPDSD